MKNVFLVSLFLFSSLVFSQIRPRQQEEKEAFVIIEEMPVFSGCEKIASKSEKQVCTQQAIQQFVSENIINPEGFKKGLYPEKVVTLYVRYLINKEGFAERFEIVGATHTAKEFEEAVLALMKKFPRMSPGLQEGEPVSVQYTIPIRFVRR